MTTRDPRFRGYSISSGTVRYADLGYLITTNDAATAEGHSGALLFTRDRGVWGAGSVDWMACAGTVCRTPAERYLVLGTRGEVRASGGGVVVEEPPIATCGVAPARRGPLREIRSIGGRAYAVGAARQAYVRLDAGVWKCIDASAQGDDDDLTMTSFESVDGFDEGEIYVVGWDGEIWRYDGTVFSRCPSPTSLALHKVRCAPDGVVYACGQGGTLLRGRGARWEVVEHDDTTADLWGVEVFHGDVFVTTLQGVYRLVGNRLLPVDFGDDVPRTCHQLSAADGVLWSVGAKDLFEFDGTRWTRLLQID